MEVYFSHSYRDGGVNSYFGDQLGDCGFRLLADRKSPVWCVAKLERYISELQGFLSIIPARQAEDGSLSYSAYIGHELALARRSGVERLLFVDDEVLGRHRSQFPKDAVPFVSDALNRDRARHQQAIRAFKARLEAQGTRAPRRVLDRQASLVAAGGKPLAEAADAIADILRTSYDVKQFRGRTALSAFEDVALFETLVQSELCVFLLDRKVTNADVLMGMAHGLSIPSIRLQYDPDATRCEPTLAGRLPWFKAPDLIPVFRKQLESFRRGFVEATNDVRAIGKEDWTPPAEQLWAIAEPLALRRHVYPRHSLVLEEVDRVNRLQGSTLAARTGRGHDLEVCGTLYRELKRLRIAYELEPQGTTAGTQAVRTPGDVFNSKVATCVDAACLFASLLWAAGLTPVIVLIDRGSYGHALAGYRAPTAPAAEDNGLGALRMQLTLGDVVLFEATGAVESEQPVGAETVEQRLDGRRTLDFMTARTVAEQMIHTEVKLRAVVDVTAS